ncbi:MAG TPA: tetratricopeptide repeat protein, partial [Chloroflexota bacterium]
MKIEAARLPVPLTRLVGRTQEIAEVCRLLRVGVRLLTLTGPGGVGKSRLALEAGLQAGEIFDDGVAFIPLAPILEPSQVGPSIARALGVVDPQSGSLVDVLVRHLHSNRLLLIFDNFEHVVAASPLLVDLLSGCPHLSMVVTSRSLLRVSGEHALPVSPLDSPANARLLPLENLAQCGAIQLFIERANAVHGDFALSDDNAEAVVEICHRLDGLPLAIELAAARVRLLPPGVLLNRLEPRLPILSRGSRDLPERLRTMRDAIAWSYDLLSPAEQALFRRLAAFAGGCGLEAAEAVRTASPVLPIDTLDGLAELVDQSLVYQVTGPIGEPRFLMLETIREYALERLRAHDEESSVRRAHAVYFAKLSEEAGTGLRGPEQQRWRDRLDAELDNLRAAVAWAADDAVVPEDTQLALRISAALWYFWLQGHSPGEGRRWLLQALTAAPEHVGGAARGRALNALALLAWRQGDYATARAHLDDSLTILGQADSPSALAEALHALGHVVFEGGDYAGAEALFEESRSRYQDLGDAWNTIPLIGDLGMVAYHRGSYVEAKRIFEETHRLSKQYGLTDRMADALNRWGDLARLSNDLDQAQTLYEQSWVLWKEARGMPGVASALHKLSQLRRHRGEMDDAMALLRESVHLQQELGNKQGIAECLAGFGGLAYDRGDPKRAARLLAAAARVLEDTGAPLAPADRVEFERDVAAARSALGESAYQAAWEEGQALTVEEVVAEVLNERGPGRVIPAESRPLVPNLERVPLSAREREVAVLIARGLSNREIAGALTITEKTAANHVDHILTKLDMRSRTQIAV